MACFDLFSSFTDSNYQHLETICLEDFNPSVPPVDNDHQTMNLKITSLAHRKREIEKSHDRVMGMVARVENEVLKPHLQKVERAINEKVKKQVDEIINATIRQENSEWRDDPVLINSAENLALEKLGQIAPKLYEDSKKEASDLINEVLDDLKIHDQLKHKARNQFLLSTERSLRAQINSLIDRSISKGIANVKNSIESIKVSGDNNRQELLNTPSIEAVPYRPLTFDKEEIDKVSLETLTDQEKDVLVASIDPPAPLDREYLKTLPFIQRNNHVIGRLEKYKPYHDQGKNLKNIALGYLDTAQELHDENANDLADRVQGAAIEIADVAMGFLPFANDAYELFVGKSIVKGESLSNTERAIAGVGLIADVLTLGAATATVGAVKVLGRLGKNIFKRARALDKFQAVQKIFDRSGEIYDSARKFGARLKDEVLSFANLNKKLFKHKSPNPKNIADFERFKADLAVQEIKGAKAVGSALKDDAFHRSASYMLDQAAKAGKYSSFKNQRTGEVFNLLQVEGGLKIKPVQPHAKGIYEWLVNSKGELVHQRFIKNGKITGFPNQARGL